MDIIKIGRDNEDIFYDHVRGREFEFFFYVMDYKQYPNIQVQDLKADGLTGNRNGVAERNRRKCQQRDMV